MACAVDSRGNDFAWGRPFLADDTTTPTAVFSISLGTMTGSRRELVSKPPTGPAGGMPSSNTAADFKALIGFVLQFLGLGAGFRTSRALGVRARLTWVGTGARPAPTIAPTTFSPRLFPLPAWGGGWGGRDPEPGSEEHRVVSSLS